MDAVLCARGGYGGAGDGRPARLGGDAGGRAKVLVGFSDITVLHQAFATRLGLVTLHGPAAAGVDFIRNARAQEHLRATLFAPESVRTITAAPPGGSALVPGRARGVTLGGCLSMLASDLGTPHAHASARGGLPLIEDVGESAYRLDRFLTQLLRSGWLGEVAGIALGSWARCGPYEELRAVFADRLGGLGVPVADEFGFGHCAGALRCPSGWRPNWTRIRAP